MTLRELAREAPEQTADQQVEAWAGARVPADVLHLDVAAAGRVSTGVLEAQVRHLRAEAARGGYVAEADAAGEVDAGRRALGALVGLDDVAFSDSAGTAFATLLGAWPLERGARVGTVPGEYAPNAQVLRLLAAARGWQLVDLPVDPLGRITGVPDCDLVTFPQVASQRGVAQPVTDVLASGVPVVLDVAQSLGQTAVPAGCAAYVGTSRKWLCGPRGVGLLAVAPEWQERLPTPPSLTTERGLRRFDTAEAHVAGRVGLAVAAREWSPALLPVLQARAAYARQVLADTRWQDEAWQVVEPVDEPTGITTLTGCDPVRLRAALLARGVLVSAVPVSRSGDLPEPVLRVSTAAWVEPADLDRLAAALREVSR